MSPATGPGEGRVVSAHVIDVQQADAQHGADELVQIRVRTPQASPTQETYGPLQAGFQFLNEALFDNRLPLCLQTLQRKSRCAGYYSPGKFVSMDGLRQVDEIALNPAYFRTQPPIEIFKTLAHEMTHCWQHHFGKPKKSGYHDKEWAAKMRSIGLQPSSTGAVGGKETGYHMAEYVLPGGPFALSYARFEATGQLVGWGDAFTRGVDDPVRPKRLKFICPHCGGNVHGTEKTATLCTFCTIRSYQELMGDRADLEWLRQWLVPMVPA
jgi:hypothetical protein